MVSPQTAPPRPRLRRTLPNQLAADARRLHPALPSRNPTFAVALPKRPSRNSNSNSETVTRTHSRRIQTARRTRTERVARI
jgi:hypothetical protein